MGNSPMGNSLGFDFFAGVAFFLLLAPGLEDRTPRDLTPSRPEPGKGGEGSELVLFGSCPALRALCGYDAALSPSLLGGFPGSDQ